MLELLELLEILELLGILDKKNYGRKNKNDARIG